MQRRRSRCRARACQDQTTSNPANPDTVRLSHPGNRRLKGVAPPRTGRARGARRYPEISAAEQHRRNVGRHRRRRPVDDIAVRHLPHAICQGRTARPYVVGPAGTTERPSGGRRTWTAAFRVTANLLRPTSGTSVTRTGPNPGPRQVDHVEKRTILDMINFCPPSTPIAM